MRDGQRNFGADSAQIGRSQASSQIMPINLLVTQASQFTV